MTEETKKVVINRCFGGFGLSNKAYERLIELGIEVKAYRHGEKDPTTGLFNNYNEDNKGEFIFDRTLEHPQSSKNSITLDKDRIKFTGRYWNTWIDRSREHPLLVQTVEELGDVANGRFARLEIVEIPSDVNYEIDDYDGQESIHEQHRSW